MLELVNDALKREDSWTLMLPVRTHEGAEIIAARLGRTIGKPDFSHAVDPAGQRPSFASKGLVDAAELRATIPGITRVHQLARELYKRVLRREAPVILGDFEWQDLNAAIEHKRDSGLNIAFRASAEDPDFSDPEFLRDLYCALPSLPRLIYAVSGKKIFVIKEFLVRQAVHQLWEIKPEPVND